MIRAIWSISSLLYSLLRAALLARDTSKSSGASLKDAAPRGDLPAMTDSSRAEMLRDSSLRLNDSSGAAESTAGAPAPAEPASPSSLGASGGVPSRSARRDFRRCASSPARSARS